MISFSTHVFLLSWLFFALLQSVHGSATSSSIPSLLSVLKTSLEMWKLLFCLSDQRCQLAKSLCLRKGSCWGYWVKFPASWGSESSWTSVWQPVPSTSWGFFAPSVDSPAICHFLHVGCVPNNAVCRCQIPSLSCLAININRAEHFTLWPKMGINSTGSLLIALQYELL